jgi:hypothetical protein
VVADQARKEQGMEVKAITKNHMLFVGNPGTGKTTMGRLVAMLLHKVGILPTNRFKEVQREDLVATHVGQTAPKTEAVVMDIKDGVYCCLSTRCPPRFERRALPQQRCAAADPHVHVHVHVHVCMSVATTEMCRC